MKKLLLIASVWMAAAAPAALDCTAFAHKAAIALSYSGEPLAGFPLLVKVVAGDGGFSYADCALDGGQDVRFASAEGEELPSEVVEWNENGTSEFYVRIPELAPSTVIYMLWGNAAAGARDATARVFSPEDYLLSWSFEESGNLALDGTGASAHGIAVNSPAVAAGVAGKAREFVSASKQSFRLVAPSWESLRTAASYTYEGWAKWDALPSAKAQIFGISRNNWHEGSFVNLQTDGKIEMKDGNGSSANLTSAALETGVWHHLMFTHDGSTGRGTLYVDGVEAAHTTKVFTRTSTDYSYDVGTSRCTGYINNYFGGLVDEVRVAGVCRSADYAAATYTNVVDYGNFVSFANADATALPSFAPAAKQYTVSVSAGAGGSVSEPLDGALYDAGSVVEVTAMPTDDTTAFYAWDGNCPTLQVFTASLKLPVDQPRSVTAVFGRAWHVRAADGDDATADGTSSAPYASLEAAIAAATAAGDFPAVVLVGDGEYTLTYASPTGDISGDDGGCNYAILVADKIAIRSVNGPAATSINCAYQNNRGGIEFNNPGSVLDGFCVTNAYAASWNLRGALVQLRAGHAQNCIFGDSQINAQNCSGVNLTAGWIRNCVFRGFKTNSSSGHGGPLRTLGGIIDSCVFSNNSHNAGIRINNSLVRNCLFADNRTALNNSTYGNGGALYDTGENNGRSLAENCTFVDNYAQYYGGAIYGACAAVNCAFAGNKATQAANGQDFYNTAVAYCVAPTAPTGDGNKTAAAGVADAANGDYSPTSVSATRDAGFVLNWLYEPGRIDFAGNARVFNLPDIGAFEYIPTGDEFAVSVIADAYTGTDTLTVHFTATIEGADEVTYAWDFGDGKKSSEAAPVHTYSASGYYTVTLEIADKANPERTASFDGGDAFIKVMPSVCYVRAAGESTPVEPYGTPQTAANDLYSASLMQPAKIDVGEGDIPVGNIAEFYIYAPIEIRGHGREVTRINLGGGNKRIFLRNDDAVLADLTVRNGYAGGLWNEGMVNIDAAGATVTNCVIRDGSRANDGLVAIKDAGGRLIDCVVCNGTMSSGRGGGVSVRKTVNAVPMGIIDRCVITNNTVRGINSTWGDEAAKGSGGGILVYGGARARVRNTLVANNRIVAAGAAHTENYGAGLYAGVNADVSLENCTIVSNSVDYGHSAGLYACATATLAVTNTVVWGNFAGGDTGTPAGDDIGVRDGASAVFSHCLAPEFADAPAAWTVEACKSGDPLFKNFDAGDYTFGGSSPLANGGAKMEWMAGAVDLRGFSRMQGKPDIGCYECAAGGGLTILVR